MDLLLLLGINQNPVIFSLVTVLLLVIFAGIASIFVGYTDEVLVLY